MWILIFAMAVLFLGGIFCVLTDLSDIEHDVENKDMED